MRRLSVTGAGLLVFLGVAAATPLPASAADTVPLVQSNWFWHHAESDAPVAGLPAAPEPSNVPAGDLPVASTDGKGTPSKLSLLAFSLPTPPYTVSAFTLTLSLDPAATKLAAEAPRLAVELPSRTWLNGPGGEQDTSSAPSLDPATAVLGKPSADGSSYTFAVPGFAQQWLEDTNVGLAIVPAPGYTTPFQVSFLGGPKVAAALTGSAAPVTTVTDAPAEAAPAPAPAVAPAPALGSTGVVAALPPANPGAAPAPPLVAGAQPQPRPQVVAVPPVQTRVLPDVSARPTPALLWTGLAVLALLAGCSLVLGGEPVAVARSGSRLQQVLSARASARPAASLTGPRTTAPALTQSPA